ncbi:hypothetical protein DFH09DRAFT_1332629 [Mycena vulgaris]|nr:hypothetical protein DFH09DRAFT_1332629 [Mycena vulgaris]
MRQYFSIRVESDDEPLHSEDSNPPEEMVHTHHHNNWARLNIPDYQLDIAEDGDYILWTAAGEALDHASRAPLPVPSYGRLLEEFHHENGTRPSSTQASIELAAIEAIGSEDTARSEWEDVQRSQPTFALGYSPALLRTTAIRLDDLVPRFSQLISEMRDAIVILEGLAAQHAGARNLIEGLTGFPSGSLSRIPCLLQRALTANRVLTDDLELNIRRLEFRKGRMVIAQRDVEFELTRRMLAREAHQQGPRHDAALTVKDDGLYGPVINISPSPSPPHHPWQVTDIGPESPPSPLRSSPPSYPGSPHESDGYYSADEHASLSRAPGFGGPQSEDGDDDNEPVVLAAHRVVLDTIPSDSLESIGMRVFESSPAHEPHIEEGPTVGPTITYSSRSDELVLRSVVIHDSRHAERYSTYLTASGELRIERSPLPKYHHHNPHFQDQHRAALALAIRERAAELDGETTRTQDGFPDTEPPLFPGTVYHEGLASTGPDGDDVCASPRFRAQALAQRVEHLSNIRRPRSHPVKDEDEKIGLMDQPSRSSKTIACLSALIDIGTTKAYAHFDSDSNTDSMTPEYANTIDGVRIPLTEQVTLQLGCVGSRSKINFVTRVPIDFGGVRGHLYFDQVNLDRYDVVVDTPFMNRHGAILDFGKR